MRKTLMCGAIAGAIGAALAATPANAQYLTGFLGGSNLEPLTQSPLILNLEAQSSTTRRKPTSTLTISSF